MPELSIPLEALLGRSIDRPEGPDKRGIPEAQIERLRELTDRYRAPNPFRPHDLVTPRADSLLAGAGDVHIVLEIVGRITPTFRRGDCCSDKPFDMRVAWLDRDGDVRMNWVESVSMERWPSANPNAGRTPSSPDQTLASREAITA